MNMCEQNDEDLAMRMAGVHSVEDAKEAYQHLLARHEALTFRFLVSRVGSAAAPDLHQDTWISVWNSRAKYKSSCFRAWVMQIARNLSIDYGRKLSRQREQALPKEGYLDPTDESSAVETMIDTEERSVLLKCLDLLERRSRQIVAARLRGEDYDTICEQQELSAANARKIFFRSKEELSQCVQANI